MKEIQNMEYSLLAVRYLFLLQAKEKIRADWITISSEFKFLNGSEFKIEVLDYAVKYDSSILKTKLQRIQDIAQEIINIWNEQLCHYKFDYHPTKEYEIFCSLWRNADFPFKEGEYLFVQRIKNYPEITELKGNFFLDDNRFWRKIDYFDNDALRRIKSNENYYFTASYILCDFVCKIHNFLFEEVFNSQGDNEQVGEERMNVNTFPVLLNSFKENNLIQRLENLSPIKRIEYHLNIVTPLINKDSSFDTCENREEAIINSTRNAAYLFNVDISEIDRTAYGIMPKDVFKRLFEPYDIEYNRVVNDRSAKLLWEKEKSHIDSELKKYKRAQMSMEDGVSKLRSEYDKTFGNYENIPENIKFEKICFDSYILPYFDSMLKETETTLRDKPILPKKLISFDRDETIRKLHTGFVGYFPEMGDELEKALNGEQLKKPLQFPHNQNKFVEVFKRVKYNGCLLSTSTEIRDWICSNFTFRYKRGDKIEIRDFNKSTVWDILTKDKGEPAKKERIFDCEWLPYKSYSQRQRETEKEQL
jgi:hypothetical protein